MVGVIFLIGLFCCFGGAPWWGALLILVSVVWAIFDLISPDSNGGLGVGAKTTIGTAAGFGIGYSIGKGLAEMSESNNDNDNK